MAFDAFLKLDGIPGDSMDKAHKGEINVLSFSWGVTTAGRRRRPQVEDFTVVKQVDSASPLLLEAICEGQVIKSAVFSVEKVGDQSQAIFKFYFDDLMVTSLSPAGQSGDQVPVESLSLNFRSVDYEVYSQNRDGSTGAVRKGSCDQPSRGREPMTEEPER
jgi:type VI secretion system secreted protein Hcp